MKLTPDEIKQARHSMGLTQTEAANSVGVALRTWQHWEFGDRKMPTPATRLFKLLLESRKCQ